MSMFDRFFKEEQKPIAAIGADAPVQPVEVVGAHATTKLKLNFKSLPKKMVQAMADQTTGQIIDRKEEESSTPKSRGRLSDAFAAAARDMTDRRDERGSEARAVTVATIERTSIQMPRPAMPRPRAPSLGL